MKRSSQNLQMFLALLAALGLVGLGCERTIDDDGDFDFIEINEPGGGGGGGGGGANPPPIPGG